MEPLRTKKGREKERRKRLDEKYQTTKKEKSCGNKMCEMSKGNRLSNQL